jgi:release factor glutamine methyltransferase
MPVRVLTLPGVFRPMSDSRLLAAVLRRSMPAGGTALDVCTGSGLLAITAGLSGAREVTAVDVSRRALVTARLNARLNGVTLRALRGDLFAPVEAERFDVIVSNPPYVPSRDIPARGRSRAWDAGPDGRTFIDRLCAEAPEHLGPGGPLLIVHSSIVGTGESIRRLEAGGLSAEVAATHRGELGPLMTARARDLERQGLLRRGERREDVVVIRALRPDGATPGPSPRRSSEAGCGLRRSAPG